MRLLYDCHICIQYVLCTDSLLLIIQVTNIIALLLYIIKVHKYGLISACKLITIVELQLNKVQKIFLLFLKK